MEAGRHPQDKQLSDLVGELTLHCPEFSTWWNDHRVLRRTHGTKYYHHPLVGDLYFSYESFQAPGDIDQTLCVYNVEPGSATVQALQLLTNWTAPQHDTRQQSEPSTPPAGARLRPAAGVPRGRCPIVAPPHQPPTGPAATSADARKAALPWMRERPPTCEKHGRDDRI
ncbi:hypothetical protein [Streptomyces sp. NPDC057580]|uniref:MmyB family transcriptional regulator n=1 Tax=Streptomyces sp. NPDC057580 TaxID=3346173 RepID=UPI00368D8A0D